MPVTLVSGFAGSGKTTLINQLKASLRSRRLAVLVDDGEKDLFAEIEQALNIEGADLIVIECASNLEPYFVAEHLLSGDEQTPPPAGLKIDTAVTVVDAMSFMSLVLSSAKLTAAGLAFDSEDERAVPELLLEQIEFSDVILINKIEQVEEKALQVLEALLERLNPHARLIRVPKAQLRSRDVVETGIFDFDETDDGAGWLAELRGEFDGQESRHGVTSFTFDERTPFHPERFAELLQDFRIEGLVRVKGSVWVASRHNEIGVWSLAGGSSVLTYGGAWFAATPARQWPPDERERQEIMEEWVPPFGDRRQEIAFLGIQLDEHEIRRRLRRCLLTPDEMKNGPDSWHLLPDPLPDWHLADGEDDY